MSNTAKQNAEAKQALILQSFQNDLNALKQTATDWYGNEYKSSNERLYSIFSQIYAMYEQLKISGNNNTEKRMWIQSELAKKKVPLPKKPTIIQLLVPYAFYVDEVDITQQKKRMSAYVRVLTTAIEDKNVMADNIAQWIADEGGIENIRQKATKSSVTKEDRSTKGSELLKDAKSLASISTQKSKSFAPHKKGEAVVLVGLVNADGTISIKHEIYEEEYKSKISGKTSIKTALANVFSKHNENAEKTTEKTDAEKRATEKNVSVEQLIANEQKNATTSFPTEQAKAA